MYPPVQDIAAILARPQGTDAAVRAGEGPRTVKQILGLLGVLDAKAHIYVVRTLIEQAGILADDAVAVRSVAG